MKSFFFRYSEQLLSDITWLCTSEIDAAQLRLRSVTEIAPKSPSFSCVSRIPIQYCFPIRAGVKTAWKLKFDSILFWMRVWHDLFTDTAAILNLLDLRSIMGCPAGMSTIRYNRSVYMYTAIGMWVITCSWHCSCRTYYCFFPLAIINISPWPLVPFLQISLKNSELKTTYNTFRHCRVHFFRQLFSK